MRATTLLFLCFLGLASTAALSLERYRTNLLVHDTLAFNHLKNYSSANKLRLAIRNSEKDLINSTDKLYSLGQAATSLAITLAKREEGKKEAYLLLCSASDFYRRATKLSPANALAHLGWIDTSGLLGDANCHKTIEDYEKRLTLVSSLAPNSATVLYKKALVEIGLRKPELATKTFRHLEEISPHFGTKHREYVISLLQHHNFAADLLSTAIPRKLPQLYHWLRKLEQQHPEKTAEFAKIFSPPAIIALNNLSNENGHSAETKLRYAKLLLNSEATRIDNELRSAVDQLLANQYQAIGNNSLAKLFRTRSNLDRLVVNQSIIEADDWPETGNFQTWLENYNQRAAVLNTLNNSIGVKIPEGQTGKLLILEATSDKLLVSGENIELLLSDDNQRYLTCQSCKKPQMFTLNNRQWVVWDLGNTDTRYLKIHYPKAIRGPLFTNSLNKLVNLYG